MKKKVVIIGGGFGGSYVAKELEKDFDVNLIDTKDYFEFTPGVLRTIVNPTHIRNIQVLHNHYLKWTKVFVGLVKDIDEKFVYLENKQIRYDYLVISSGSTYEAPFKEQRVVTATRAGHLKDYYNSLCLAKSVLIVGGGLVGIELTGEILDRYNDKKITIVHSGEHLIARNGSKAINYAEKYLKKKGVKIIYNKKMVNKKGRFCILDDNKRIKADLVFLCTGIKPNYSFMKGQFKKNLNSKNQIAVDKNLRINRQKNIFAMGDVTNIKEEKTAQNAERHGKIIVHNIYRIEEKKELCEYKHKNSPLLISLGKYRGILSKGDFVMTGFIPAIMKWGIEKWEMWKKRKI